MANRNLHWLICFAGLFIIPQISTSQTNHQAIVEKVIAKRAAFESVQYAIDVHLKRFMYDDTIHFSAKTELVRKPQDTLFHGLVFIDMDTTWYGYDGEKIFYLNKMANEVEYTNATTNPGAFILSTFINNLVDDGFLKINTGLRLITNEPEYEAHYSDTIIDGVKCLGISFKLPVGEEITRQFNFVAIDLGFFTIKKRISSLYFQDSEEYKEWDYKKIVFGHETGIAKLNYKNSYPDIKETQYEHPNESDSQNIDFDWSSLKGKVFNRDTFVNLIDFKAPFTILDFWYSSCYPCIKSIPAVRQIADLYQSKGVKFFGVNMIDDETKDKSKLDKFFSHNPVPYETIMLDQSYHGRIKVEGFPTFLILDKNLNVIYKEVGYNENLFEEVSAILDEKLK